MTPRTPPGRDERRAAALRDNLRRRKAQARGRADGAGDSAPAQADTPPGGDVFEDDERDADSGGRAPDQQ